MKKKPKLRDREKRLKLKDKGSKPNKRLKG
jgi:hypothetical protein